MTRRMLVVDDEETIRWALRELFMEDGWEVHCAADGDQAHQLIGQNAYRFIITDLKMPGRSGVEVIRSARRRSPHMGVLVLTGYASLETAIEAVRLRAWDYVTKPCQVSYLKERVDAFLEAAPSAAPKPAGAAPPDESSLRAFLDGAGTELLAFDRIDPDAQSHRVLDELRRVCGDLGFEGERTAGLVQLALEAIAALCDGDVRPLGRAALLEGHLLVGFSAPRSDRTAADSLRAVAERLGLHARLLPCDGTDSIVLSERV